MNHVLRDPVRRAVSAVVVEMGKYDRQVAAFLDLYGHDRVRVFFFEDDGVVTVMFPKG